MRHGKKFNHLGRTTSHRKAMLSNMASSLIKYKRINTTIAKAKALRKYVEPLITKAKENSTNSRRVVFQYLQDKESVIELFGAVAEKVANRSGGYTRILKTGSRLGDNAEMCVMELVDYNELLLEESKPKASKRSRRSKSKSASSETAVVEEAEVLASEPEVKDETIEAADPKKKTSDEEEEKKD
ncbi:MAG: 50S ribosomal protein L17 [Flammeovirgaceae bacterium TMED32]|nr:MAG: 50S ribosomal protein L17 [Flammeovirgaceae bacterium TMED32]